MRKESVFVMVTILFLLITAHPVAGNEQIKRLKSVEKCMDSITYVLQRMSQEYMRAGANPSGPALRAAHQSVRVLHSKIFMLTLELGELNVGMMKREILSKVDEALRKCSLKSGG